MVSVICRSLICALLVAVCSTNTAASEWQRATIYYYDWDVQVRSALTVQDVRQHFYTKIDVAHADEVKKLGKLIGSRKFQRGPSPPGIDVRLVIDLYSTDGERMTYFATYFRLYSESGLSSVEIDDSFRNRFRIAD